MKKFFAVLLVAMMMLSTIASAEVITYMDHFNEDTKRAGVEALVAGTTALHPEYEFEVSHQGFDSFLEALRAKMAAGDPPDVFQGIPREFPELIEAGKILDLAGWEVLDRINASAVAETTVGEHVWAMPMDKIVCCLFINKDCFEKNGIALPTTRSEFLDACAKLEAAGIQPIGLGLASSAGTLDSFDYMLTPRMNNENLFGIKAGFDDGSAKFADYPVFKENLKDWNELLMDWASPNELTLDRPELLVALANGSVAMVLSGNYSVGQIRANNPEGNFGILPYPLYEEAEKNGLVLGIDDSFMIAAESDCIEGAKAYLDYATTPEGVSAWIENSLMLSAVDTIKIELTEPMTADMQAFLDNGGAQYFQAGCQWEGATLSKMQSLMQSYAALSYEERTDYDAAIAWLDAEFDAMR